MDTYTRYFVGDAPVVDRAALHDRILDALSDLPTPGGRERPAALIVVGIPGSGKNSVASRLVGDDHAWIDSDVIKARLPEFVAATPEQQQEASRLVHREANHVAHRLWYRVIDRRLNLVFVGTGRDIDLYQACFAELRERGYTLRLIWTFVDPSVARERVRQRGMTTGRWVDDAVIDDADAAIAGNFRRLCTAADEAEVLDASTSPPGLVWSRTADGQERVHHPGLAHRLLGANTSSLDPIDPCRHALVGVVSRGDRVLVLERQPGKTFDPGRWEFVSAARVDFSSDLARQAVAQVRHETGLDAALVLAGRHFDVEDSYGRWRLYPFLLRAEHGTVALRPRDHRDHRWVEAASFSAFVERHECVKDLAKNLAALDQPARVWFCTPNERPFGCFSNFSPHGFELDGERWSTAEHYYQAQKFDDPAHLRAIRLASSPADAAALGNSRAHPRRAGWSALKIEAMKRAVTSKFAAHAELRALLLGTGEAELRESSPDDMFWGCGADGTGQNRLGRILMEVRSALRSPSTLDARGCRAGADHRDASPCSVRPRDGGRGR
jgi:ribA/ribD-fused uncharacterized protein